MQVLPSCPPVRGLPHGEVSHVWHPACASRRQAAAVLQRWLRCKRINSISNPAKKSWAPQPHSVKPCKAPVCCLRAFHGAGRHGPPNSSLAVGPGHPSAQQGMHAWAVQPTVRVKDAANMSCQHCPCSDACGLRAVWLSARLGPGKFFFVRCLSPDHPRRFAGCDPSYSTSLGRFSSSPICHDTAGNTCVQVAAPSWACIYDQASLWLDHPRALCRLTSGSQTLV